MKELEKRTTELEEHKVRVDEQTDHLQTLMLLVAARKEQSGIHAPPHGPS